MVLFSATIGNFTSRRSSLRILRQFFRDARSAAVGTRAQDARLPAELRMILAKRGLGPSSHQPNWDEYFHSLHWDGGKETYRPWKLRHIPHGDSLDGDHNATNSLPSYDSKVSDVSTRHPSARFRLWYRDRRDRFRVWWWRRRVAVCQFLVSICPILAGLAGGLGILHLAGEGGWSCRHILLSSMLGIWLLSSAFSSGVYSLIKDADSRWTKYHWYACLLKDMMIGGAILGWVSISAAGMFSCLCRVAPCLGQSMLTQIKAFSTAVAVGVGNYSWVAARGCLWTSTSAICGTTQMCFRELSAGSSGFSCCLLLR